MKPALLRGSLALPIERVDVEALKKVLTVQFKPMGEEEAREIEAFRVGGGYIRVPRQFGIDFCERSGIDYKDCTSVGVPIVFPRVPSLREYQVEPLKRVEDCFEYHCDTIFRAHTGWGKSIGVLTVAARLGVSTLIIVDQENLKEQWYGVLMDRFGFKAEEIGIIQGKKCSYEGKAVTIAMVQTLSQKRFAQKLYDAFGFVVVDECHVIGAPTFSSVLLDFSATYRMGVSATPKRRDALQKLIDYNLGPVRVYVDDEHDPSAVYIATHPTVYSAYANKAPKIGRFINEVTGDGSRNLLVAESAAYLHDTGRDILVLSDRVEHLHHLKSLCYYLGIPDDEMGVYAGYTLEYRYAKDPTPIRRPPGLTKHAGDDDTKAGFYYTPVVLKLISKKSRKKDLDQVKTTARIIWSTYGKFSKGVDEPRLCGGVDASPRSRSEQVQGRILRKVDGKLRPIWLTYEDTSSYRSLFGLASRLSDYIKNNSMVSRWSLEGGKDKAKCSAKEIQRGIYEEVERLKSLEIVTSSDGAGHVLLTRQQAIKRSSGHVSASKEGTRSATSVRSSRSITAEVVSRKGSRVG